MTARELANSPLPTAANGILISSVATYAAADPTGAPSRYEIFVGLNKEVATQFYLGTGRTGFIDTSPQLLGASYDVGLLKHYDPATGILTIVQNTGGGLTNLATGWNAAAAAQQFAYFEVFVSDPS